MALFGAQLKRLRTKNEVLTVQAFNDKFAAVSGTFQGIYKDQSAFLGGVGASLGIPARM